MKSAKELAWGHLDHLAVGIGKRWIGMPSIKTAGEYVEKIFQECGWKTTRQEYPCPQWTCRIGVLDVDGNVLEAKINTFSPSCDIKGALVFCCTAAELKQAEITGKIAVLTGALTRQDWTPRYACYVQGPDPVVQMLEEKQPAAVIMVSPKLDVYRPIYEDWEFKIPSVSISARTGLYLLQQSDQQVMIHIESQRIPSSTFSVVARREGKRKERILISAHYDTDHTTPGAFDNGSGTAILLALAQTLPKTDTGIELVAFSGEDGSAIEPTVYFEQTSPEDVARLLAVINIDGVGIKLGSNSITLMAGSQKLEQGLRTIQQEYPAVSWVDPWVESDHTAFAWRGIPSIPLSSAGWPGVHHTPDDTMEWMDIEKLGESLELTRRVIAFLQDKQSDWLKLKDN